MKIYDLVPADKLDEMFADKSVKSSVAEELGVEVYSYRARMATAPYDAWNEEIKKLRGVIVDSDTKEVLARGFDKFFNYEQLPFAHKIGNNTKISAYDKADGSLLICYVDKNGKVRFSTKGSAKSAVADKANAWVANKLGDWVPPKGVSMLFEFVSPDNKIVLEYPKTDFIFLGGVDNETGAFIAPEFFDVPFTKVEKMPFKTVSDCIKAQKEERDGEGYVVHVLEGDYAGLMFKLKHEEYLALHKLVMNYSHKRVLRLMWFEDNGIAKKTKRADDPEVIEWASQFPDELAQDAINYMNEVWGYVDTAVDKAYTYIDKRRSKCGNDRKLWASVMKEDDLDPLTLNLAFTLINGGDRERLNITVFKHINRTNMFRDWFD